MINSITIDLINNMGLLLAISTIYMLMPIKGNKVKGLMGVVAGCIIGIVGIGIMSNPFELSKGLFFDTRTILISTTGLFFGLLPTIIAVLITCFYRIYEGGIGAFTGISTIIVAALIGLVWRYTRYKKLIANKKFTALELYGLGVFTHIGMLACMMLLPSQLAPGVLSTISLPIITLFPIGTVILGQIFLAHSNKEETRVKLAQSEERYRSLFQNDHAVMLLIDPKTGAIVDANPAAAHYYGWSKEQLKSMNIGEINTLSAQEVQREMRLAADQKRNYFIFKHRDSSSEVHDVEVFSGPIVVNGENLLYSIVHDITNRIIAEKKLKESEERLRVTLMSVGDGVITTDERGCIAMVNKVGEAITGWNKDDIIGKPFNENFTIINEYTRGPVEDPIQKVLQTGRIIGLANHTILIRGDGMEVPIADSAAPILDEEGIARGVVLVVRDVTEESKRQREIVYLGYHDSLTGLHNRAFFEEQLRTLNIAANLPITIMIGDVNGLKMTNDAFGHTMGDRLLKETAKAIKTACRETDIVARWGGDEFIALLCKTDGKKAERICNRIKLKCSKVHMEFIDFSISLGYDTKYGEEDIIAVIQNAEDYMYRKKTLESQSMRGNTINAILSALHEISPRERLHSDRVSKLCENIGMAMGMSQREISELSLSGLMHDIGKIAISEVILNKEGHLSKEEYQEIKRHSEVGYRILNASSNMTYIAEYVLGHHERIDGRGYPNGLTGEKIPIYSKILAVADSYDAMTCDRTYRKALSAEAAIEELKTHAGTQFDPKVVQVLVDYLSNNHFIQES